MSTAPSYSNNTYKWMLTFIMFVLSLFLHVLVLVGIPLLSGLLHTTRPYERPKTFQLVMPSEQTSPAPPVPVNSSIKKQPEPQQKTEPQQVPDNDLVTNNQDSQQGIGTAKPVNENNNEPASIPGNAPSSGSTAPPTPGITPGQPQRIGSTAELDNVSFEPVYSLKPNYPDAALNAKITGYVDVDLVIGENGKVQSFSFVTIKGHPAFGVETAKVLPQWCFPPPRIKGKKCSVKYVYRINFVLN